MDFPKAFLLDREDAKYLCNERPGGFPEMLNVVWKNIKHHFDLRLAHSLNDILLVVTKEEKTTTLASTCSGIEDLFAIELRRQTLFKQLHAKFVHIEQLCELI